MNRYLVPTILADLKQKMVVLTGPRQVGKTTLAKSLFSHFQHPLYLNWDVIDDRRTLTEQSWSPRADLLVLDEIHKMKGWKAYLKGVFDGRADGQAILVTGSARMETYRQSGESLAGRYFPMHLHPVSVREWVEQGKCSADSALDRLLDRGGMPEPFLADDPGQANRWRQQYFTDLIREDVVEFSRIHEVRAMRLLVEMLRRRVGSPLSIASLSRDLQLASNTVAKYIDILEALYIIFLLRPYHRNVARAVLKAPKAYFFDTGIVVGDDGVKWENACATMLLKHTHFARECLGEAKSLHYLRTKDGVEVDFILCDNGHPIQLLECKHADHRPAASLRKFAVQFADAEAIQLVRELRREEYHKPILVARGSEWLAELSA